MNRNGEERAGDEKADAEDKEWRDLLSWDGDVNKPGSSLRGGCVRERVCVRENVFKEQYSMTGAQGVACAYADARMCCAHLCISVCV